MYYTPLLDFLIFFCSDNFLQKYLLYQQNLKKKQINFENNIERTYADEMALGMMMKVIMNRTGERETCLA